MKKFIKKSIVLGLISLFSSSLLLVNAEPILDVNDLINRIANLSRQNTMNSEKEIQRLVEKFISHLETQPLENQYEEVLHLVLLAEPHGPLTKRFVLDFLYHPQVEVDIPCTNGSTKIKTGEIYKAPMNSLLLVNNPSPNTTPPSFKYMLLPNNLDFCDIFNGNKNRVELLKSADPQANNNIPDNTKEISVITKKSEN